MERVNVRTTAEDSATGSEAQRGLGGNVCSKQPGNDLRGENGAARHVVSQRRLHRKTQPHCAGSA
jgi:hypothetical protein